MSCIERITTIRIIMVKGHIDLFFLNRPMTRKLLSKEETYKLVREIDPLASDAPSIMGLSPHILLTDTVDRNARIQVDYKSLNPQA